MSFEDGLESGLIEYINEEVFSSYIENVLSSALVKEGSSYDCKIVYTPLNGAGLKPVTRALSLAGFNDVSIVGEQKLPDGNFPTCPKPNPETRESLELGIELAKKTGAGIVVATDPDSDRMGVAVKNRADEFVLLTGNDMGVLLLDYILNRRRDEGTLPKNPIFIKTIVTTKLAEVIASSYGLETINVLTGFKFIGEKIGLLEENSEENRFVFGFEESYGYLSGSYVRDKDGVLAALLASKMYADYLKEGILLTEKIEELYGKYGYCLNTLYNLEFEGSQGFFKMQDIMKNLRNLSENALGSFKIIDTKDYLEGIDGLPKNNTICFTLENGSTVTVRPSGTEPKIRVYLYVNASSKEKALETESLMAKEIKDILKKKDSK